MSLSDDFLTIYTGGDSEEEHEHTYVTTVTKATLKKNGSVVKKCSECGYIASGKLFTGLRQLLYQKTAILIMEKHRNLLLK